MNRVFHPPLGSLDDVVAQPPYDIAQTLVANSTLVITGSMESLVEHLHDIFVDGGQCVVVSGDPGLGKTTMLHAAAAVAGVRIVFLAITGSIGDREFWHRCAQALMLDTSGNATQLADRCADALRREPTVLIVDDAHRVRASALLRLRGLKKDSGYNVGVVLCGNKLTEHLAKHKAIRINSTVPLKPLSGKDMTRHLSALHPIMKRMPQPVLDWLNDEYCDGLWFEWTNFVGKLVRQFADDDNFDPVQASLAVLLDIRGTPVSSRPNMSAA